MRTIDQALSQRILLADGSLARAVADPESGNELDISRDLRGHPDLLCLLSLTRYDRVMATHRDYLLAGADVLRTNSLRASPLTLGPFGFAEDAFVLNYKAAEAAAEAIDSVPGDGRRRFVLGIVRDDGWDAAPGAVEAAVATQVEGLVAGGADALVLDVLPGIGRIQAMLNGANRGRATATGGTGIQPPVYLQAVKGGPAIGADSLARSAGLLDYHPGHANRLELLDKALERADINLLGGGATIEETARLDEHLRARAEDGYRPVRRWVAETRTIDEVEPVSAWRRFPTADARTALETVS